MITCNVCGHINDSSRATCEECGLTTKIYDDIEDAVLAWNAREQEADYEQRNDVNVCR